MVLAFVRLCCKSLKAYGLPLLTLAYIGYHVMSNYFLQSSFPEIKSKHSLVAKHVTPEKWEKLKDVVTKTSGFTLAKVIFSFLSTLSNK